MPPKITLSGLHRGPNADYQVIVTPGRDLPPQTQSVTVPASGELRKESCMPAKASPLPQKRTTHVVSPEVFKQVYDSPHSLPGKYRWVTKDEDVRTIEKLLGIPDKTIGAPLWVSGDTRKCPKCGRETNWLDIVSSAVTRTHQKKLLIEVILGDRKYVNVEVPRAIADLACYNCKNPILDLRSFKCHNWAYARGEILQIIERATQEV
jgi:hypothetical protein